MLLKYNDLISFVTDRTLTGMREYVTFQICFYYSQDTISDWLVNYDRDPATDVWNQQLLCHWYQFNLRELFMSSVVFAEGHTYI